MKNLRSKLDKELSIMEEIEQDDFSVWDDDYREIVEDVDFKIYEEARIANKRYQELQKKKPKDLERKIAYTPQTKKALKDEDILTWVYMVTDSDADLGILQNVGGYYEVVKTNLNSLKLRRCIVNNLTYKFLKKLNAIRGEDFEKEPETIEEAVKFSKETEKILTATITQSKREEWKDFKLFMIRKFLTLPEYKLNQLIKRGLQDLYNTNYTEFLLHKARFIYKQKWNIDNVSDLVSLRNNLKFGTQLHIDSNEIVQLLEFEEYSQSFYTDIMEAVKRMTILHSSSFKSFSSVVTLPLYSNTWSLRDFGIYQQFLNGASSISYIDINTKYDISYISKRNNTYGPEKHSYVDMFDTVLKTLKLLFTDLAVQITETCKIYKRITMIRQRLKVKDFMGLLLRFIDASGCNYVTFLNDNSKTTIVQTVLGNLLVFSIPIEIFHSPYYFLNKDISFVKLERLSERNKSEMSAIYNTVNTYQARMFTEGISIKDYDIFLLNYYSRLSNIHISDIDKWIAKQRLIKAKILSTSFYVRDICAKTIQRFFQKIRTTHVYIEKILNKFLKKHIINIGKEKSKFLLDEIIENSSAKVIQKFFQKSVQLALISDKNSKSMTKHLLETRKALASRLRALKNIRLGKAAEGFKYESHTVVYMMDKNEIVIPNNFNNEKKWFGFNRNDSLNNLVLSTGNDVILLDIKTKYTNKEFIDIINCLADICSVTKSYQFVKLCRIFSGVRHKQNTIKDFIGGFCWMFKKPTVLDVLTMAQRFCKCLNKPKWLIYLVNNTEKIAETLKCLK